MSRRWFILRTNEKAKWMRRQKKKSNGISLKLKMLLIWCDNFALGFALGLSMNCALVTAGSYCRESLLQDFAWPYVYAVQRNTGMQLSAGLMKMASNYQPAVLFNITQINLFHKRSLRSGLFHRLHTPQRFTRRSKLIVLIFGKRKHSLVSDSLCFKSWKKITSDILWAPLDNSIKGSQIYLANRYLGKIMIMIFVAVMI